MRLKADFIGTTSGRYLPTPNAVPPLTLRPTYLPSVLSGEVDLPDDDDDDDYEKE